MNEGIHATSELFQHFSFLYHSGEICNNESLSASIRDSQQLECKPIFDLLFNISGVQHILGFEEERMLHVLSASKLLHVLVHLRH